MSQRRRIHAFTCEACGIGFKSSATQARYCSRACVALGQARSEPPPWYDPNQNGGLCECGCGQPTTPAPKSVKKLGTWRGKPQRFLPRHRQKGDRHYKWGGGVRRKGKVYVMVFAPDHARAGADGLVAEHILIATRALGRPLPPGAQVHHVNGNRYDNRPGNLVICPSDAYHKLLHKRMRAQDACGNANWVKCSVCKEYGDPATMKSYHGKNLYHRHLSCFIRGPQRVSTKCEGEYELARRNRDADVLARMRARNAGKKGRAA